ncbi:MAG: LysR family transcriptional regulator [Butyrivibrio sp.]|nr:LysR family transcriptional regulator [Butyrivibrio sp.]
MDFRSINYFLTVAQELNFTKAAERLNMSQPPLSNQIKELENDLGVQLFIRGKRHLQLTPAGTALLHRAEQIMTIADAARSEMKSFGNELTGTIRIGLVEGRAPYHAAKWIAGFLEEYPLVKFRLWNGSSDDVIEHMERGLSDLGVIAAPYDNEHLEGLSAGIEPWVALIHKDHPLAKENSETIALKELENEPLIIPQRQSRIAAIKKWFDSEGISIKVVCEMSSYIDAIALVEEKIGIGIFPQTTDTPNPNVVSKIIDKPMKKAEYALVWRKNQKLSMLSQEFLNFVKDYSETEKDMADNDSGTDIKNKLKKTELL